MAWANYSLDYALSGIGTTSSVSQSYEVESGWGYRSSSNQTANSYYIAGEIEAFLELFFDSLEPKKLLSNGLNLGNGWMNREWFGVYYGNSYPWIYHENLGWIFVKEESPDQAWLYREKLGWVWTEANSFPHFYMNDREEWSFVDRTSHQALLYDYRYGEWFELDRIYSIDAEAFPITGGTILGTGNYQRWEKVRLQASPQDNYVFDGWLEDDSGTNEIFEFEVSQDVLLAAKFAPKINTDLSIEQLAKSLIRFLDDRPDLTEKQKQTATAELLTLGISSTAEISVKDGATYTLPIDVSVNTSTQEQIVEIQKQLDLLTEISDEQKRLALAEILVFGHSTSLAITLKK